MSLIYTRPARRRLPTLHLSRALLTTTSCWHRLPARRASSTAPQSDPVLQDEAAAKERRARAQIRAQQVPKLDFSALDKKWRAEWDRLKRQQPRHEPDPDAPEHSRYILPMFPYPSGHLHIGHLRVYTIADCLSRFYTLQANKTILPMGWDAFGLPAENAAVQRGIDPAIWTKNNISKMKEQLECMNGSWDWDRVRALARPVPVGSVTDSHFACRKSPRATPTSTNIPRRSS